MTRRRTAQLLIAMMFLTPAHADEDEARPAYVTGLEAQFGGLASAGFGSAVFSTKLAAAAELEDEAKRRYREFTGELWDRWGEAAWMGTWRLVATRDKDQPVADLLRELTDREIRSSAGAMMDGIDDPAAAGQALAAAFDGPAVETLQVYSIGDGAQMSGLIIAARRANGEVTVLVFLLD
ncbi:hypothetical protein [Aestuariivirga sp.]|uniref:hypothetical protein n=1 Tax=Aestuariivirga sp. TaxID=2650926 RepID=UPI0035942E89